MFDINKTKVMEVFCGKNNMIY